MFFYCHGLAGDLYQCHGGPWVLYGFIPAMGLLYGFITCRAGLRLWEVRSHNVVWGLRRP